MSATATRTCRGCGQDLPPRDPAVPIELADPWAKYLHTLPSWCEPCIEAGERLEGEKIRADRMERRRKAAGIPDSLVLDLDSLESSRHPEAFAAAEAWAQGAEPGLFLHGPYGTGKTWLAAAAALKRLEDVALRWWSVPSLLARSLSGFDNPQQRAAIDALHGSLPIVLDDIDKVKPSEFALAQLFAAIDQRITAGTSLLVTTNLAPQGLADFLGDAITSRLVGYCEVHELGGADRRLG